MKRYALRKTGTNEYLQSHSSSGTGITHHEFQETNTPAMYLSPAKANQALDWWRKGSFRSDYDGGLFHKAKPHRKDIPVQIVIFDLVEVGTIGTVMEHKDE